MWGIKRKGSALQIGGRMRLGPERMGEKETQTIVYPFRLTTSTPGYPRLLDGMTFNGVGCKETEVKFEQGGL